MTRSQERRRPELFAGVITGWETMIGQDFKTDKYLGYRAILDRGSNRQRPPRDRDLERETVVQEFIEHWTKGLADAGVSPQKTYSHTAFLCAACSKDHGFPRRHRGRSSPTSVSQVLKGEPRIEAETEALTLLDRLPPKIHRIQKVLPAWIQKTANAEKATALMRELEKRLKAKSFEEAEKTADSILEMIGASEQEAAQGIPSSRARSLFSDRERSVRSPRHREPTRQGGANTSAGSSMDPSKGLSKKSAAARDLRRQEKHQRLFESRLVRH